MDAAQRVLCGDDLFNPLTSMGLQAALILAVSHFIQIIIKTVGQPSPIAQLMGGMLLGHSFLSQIPIVELYFFQSSAADYYEAMAFFGRIFIVFLIGLELDLSYVRRNFRSSTIIAYSGIVICFIFAGAISYSFFEYFAEVEGKKDQFAKFVLLLMLVMSNCASPLVARFTADLNLGSSQFGRLAVCSALVNDVSCLFMGAIVRRTGNANGFSVWGWIGSFFVTAIFSVSLRYLANWLNGWNRGNHKYMKNAQFLAVFLVVLFSAGLTEIMGENSILSSFILGVSFPKEGRTTRTLRSKLSYAVYTFVLPIYFGYVGFQANFNVFGSLTNVVGVIVILGLGIGGKMLGTLAACHALKIPFKKGVALALLLSLKGHYDLLILARARQNTDWDEIFYDMMLVAILLGALISGIAVAILVRKSPDHFGYRPISLEFRRPESELRVLSCVHSPRHVPTMARLIGALSWSTELPVTAYMMHLVELPTVIRRSASKMYHQLEEDELSDDETYGGNDAVEIGDTLDSFVSETGIYIHLLKEVSPMAKLGDEVCEESVEVRASMIVLPFHKHQRIDGKMESGKEGLRTTNQRVLRQAPCTVAILIDRGLMGCTRTAVGMQAMQHVAVLFFGGSDDREALSFSKRIGMHVQVNVTVIRFLEASSTTSSAAAAGGGGGLESSEKINISSKDDGSEVFMAMPSRGKEDDADTAYLEEFYNRYVTSGQVGYVEKYVKNGAETLMALREVGDMYQLFIVGKGARLKNGTMTTGMTEWEECPELGAVGDLLASSDFESNSSVLIIQQHKPREG